MKRLLVWCSLVVLLLATSAFAQITYDFKGTGARPAGMGGAYFGVSDDVNALTWNPAGMWIQEGPMLGLGLGMFAPRGHAGFGSDLFDHRGTWSSLRHLDFVAPIRMRGHHVVFGISFHRMAEDFDGYTLRGSDMYDGFLPGQNDNPDDIWTAPVDIEVAGRSHHTPNALSIGFGTRFYNKISVGASIDVFVGKGVTEFWLDSTLSDFHDFVGQRFTRESMIYRNDTASFSGWGVTFGGKYNGEQTSAGLVVKIPVSFRTETDTKFYIVNYEANFRKDSTRLYFENNLIKYNMPIVIGAGVAHRPNENMLLALDAEYRAYGGKNSEYRDSLLINPGAANEEFFTDRETFWKDAITVRAGGEYLWETGSSVFPVVPLRIGLAYVLIPTPNVDSAVAIVDNLGGLVSFTPLAPGSASTYRITAGLGVKWSQIVLDFAYQYNIMDRNVIYNAVRDIPLAGGLFVGYDTNNRDHVFTFSFTGYF